MKPHYDDGDGHVLWLGDCLDMLPTIPDNSIDAIVTDPPYGLEFMGKDWDTFGRNTGNGYTEKPRWTSDNIGKGFQLPNHFEAGRPFQRWCETWAALCLRVLKPGGHLLAFGAPRTYHRLACAIEDAGFEIRDSIHWVYGSGFPKGQDIGKAIDRRRDDREDVLRVTAWLRDARDAAGWTTARIDALFGFNGMGAHWTAIASKAAIVPTLEQWAMLREAMGFDDTEILPLVEQLNGRKGEIGEAFGQREVVGAGYRVRHESDVQLAPISAGSFDITAAATGDAKRWTGWNTQLKPAHEPIIVARKSTGFNTTVANVLEHGTGAINVDACRTRAGGDYRDKCASVVGIDSPRNGDTLGEWTGAREDSAHDLGRWPTNLVLTHSPDCEQVGERTVRGDPRSGQPRGVRPGGFANVGADPGDERPNGPLHGPEIVPVFRCAHGCPVAEMDRQSGITPSNARASKGRGMGYHGADGERGAWTGSDSGGGSRFFPVFRYEAKAAASERPRLADGTAHTTVKPLDLMRWLVRLVTPPGGTVLDPFVGSGTSLEAALIEGFNAIGIEREPEYADLCVARLSKPIQPSLFGDAA